jgi:hypothetical protein
LICLRNHSTLHCRDLLTSKNLLWSFDKVP